MEEQVAVRTAVSTVNLLKWVQLYPDTLFVVLDGITILALMAFVYSVAWYLDGRR